MAIYTIRQICEPGEVKLGRRVNCLDDDEALNLAQKMADAGLSLQVWRGDELLGTSTAGGVVCLVEQPHDLIGTSAEQAQRHSVYDACGSDQHV